MHPWTWDMDLSHSKVDSRCVPTGHLTMPAGTQVEIKCGVRVVVMACWRKGKWSARWLPLLFLKITNNSERKLLHPLWKACLRYDLIGLDCDRNVLDASTCTAWVALKPVWLPQVTVNGETAWAEVHWKKKELLECQNSPSRDMFGCLWWHFTYGWACCRGGTSGSRGPNSSNGQGETVNSVVTNQVEAGWLELNSKLAQAVTKHKTKKQKRGFRVRNPNSHHAFKRFVKLVFVILYTSFL